MSPTKTGANPSALLIVGAVWASVMALLPVGLVLSPPPQVTRGYYPLVIPGIPTGRYLVHDVIPGKVQGEVPP